MDNLEIWCEEEGEGVMSRDFWGWQTVSQDRPSLGSESVHACISQRTKASVSTDPRKPGVRGTGELSRTPRT